MIFDIFPLARWGVPPVGWMGVPPFLVCWIGVPLISQKGEPPWNVNRKTVKIHKNLGSNVLLKIVLWRAEVV